MISTLKSQYLAVIWALFVLVLCDMPMPGGGTSEMFFEGFDKLVHTGFFFVLAVLLFFGDIGRNPDHNRFLVTLKILFIAVLFGGGIEISQLEIFTYRSAEWWDFFADMTGTGMGIFAYCFLFRKPHHEKSF
jgi:VanZ family protein